MFQVKKMIGKKLFFYLHIWTILVLTVASNVIFMHSIFLYFKLKSVKIELSQAFSLKT